MEINRPRKVRGMITRALTTTSAALRCYDSELKTETIRQVTLIGRYVSKEAVLDYINKSHKLEAGVIALGVESVSSMTDLRAMSIEDFIKYSESVQIIDNDMEV